MSRARAAPSAATTAATRGVVQTALAPAAGSAGETEGYGTQAEYGEAAAPLPAPQGNPLVPNLAGLQPLGPTEFYNAGNLYEKINGRAPAYLGFNFQELRCRSFAVPGAPDSFVDIYEFNFDSPVNAFGMFASERDPKGDVVDFAPDGYAGEMGFFFRQGAHYVQVIASDLKAETATLAKALAQDRAGQSAGRQHRPGRPQAAAGDRSRPGQRPVRAENALGQEFLKNVFQGNYTFGGQTLPFFIMVTSPDQAAAAWQSLADLPIKFGGKLTPLPDRERGARVSGGKFRHLEGGVPERRAKSAGCSTRRTPPQLASLWSSTWQETVP